ncbi:MAG: dCMP deaminase family protein [Oscillospiraceae bacterium]|jgi:dCMP deaminase|nr:dCMP deaminase family protein [Oscillospiraceae bacterium]
MDLTTRPSKSEYYLDIARAVSARATCLRRRFGAVIVKDDEIISTGYNGAPRGCANCCDLGICKREQLNIPPGERYELCRSVHAEANAIIAADFTKMRGAVLYLYCVADTGGYYCEPCGMCKRLLINSGIALVVTPEKDYVVADWQNSI